jgi:hypothetical protein
MEPTVRKSEVLRYLGYAGQEMTEDLDSRVDEIVLRCQADQHPSGVFQVHPIAWTEDGRGRPAVSVEGTSLLFEGDDIVEYLQGATECALMACTLGLKSERELRRLSVIDAVDALIYGSACTDLVEREADLVESRIVSAAHERGLHTNYRYSPGYGDFDLAIQRPFIDALDAGRQLGVTVTDRNLLIPVKSITAVVGLYPQPPAQAKVGCAWCNCRDFCTVRAHGDTCYGRGDAR